MVGDCVSARIALLTDQVALDQIALLLSRYLSGSLYDISEVVGSSSTCAVCMSDTHLSSFYLSISNRIPSELAKKSRNILFRSYLLPH